MPVFPMHAPDTPQCRTCCTPYYYSTLIHTRGRSFPTVTHVPTREISGYFMGVAKMRRDVPYTPATNYKWSSFRRECVTWNLNYSFPQPSIIIMFFPSYLNTRIFRIESHKKSISKKLRFPISIIACFQIALKYYYLPLAKIVNYYEKTYMYMHIHIYIILDLRCKVVFHRIRNPVVRDRKRERDWQSPA